MITESWKIRIGIILSTISNSLRILGTERKPMEHNSETREFELPLELQFSMRKAELHAKELTWDQLYYALLNLYHQRLMEWHAIQAILCEENIKLEFDVPTEIELIELASVPFDDFDEEDDGLMPF